MGGSLLEMMVVLAASAILTLVSIREDLAKRRGEILSAEGQNEAVIVSALANWANDNFANLLAEYTQSGGAALTAPTLDQLQTSGELKQNYNAGPFWGGEYTIQMSMVPAGCTADAGNCHVSWAFYPSLPYSRNGVLDVSGASQIALAGNASGGQFGYSSTRNPGTVYGINGAWQASNPLAGTPAASILATNGPNQDGNSLYIRRDGSLTWTGDQNVNGVNLHNVSNLDATGTLSAAELTASDAIAASGPISAGTTVSTGAMGWPRTACTSVNAMTGASDNSGLMLSCQNVSGLLEWMPIGGQKLWYGYTNIPSGGGTVVPSPVCPAGGTPGIVVTGQSTYTDPTAAVNYPISGTGPWMVFITDGNGTVIPGNAVASTFCSY